MKAVFAIPGDRHRRTGGFLYESALLDALRGLGHDVEYLCLPDAFPDPAPADVAETLRLLRAVPGGVPLILDGFIPGHLGGDALAHIPAPLYPVIHHPLGLETGLPADRASALLAAERAALAHATRIVVPSAYTGRTLVDLFAVDPERLIVAPPGFDEAPRTRAPMTPPLILAVGLLAERKGHDVLLQALAQVGDLDWQARIVGATHDPRVAEALRRQTKALDLQPRVAFTGPLGAAALDALYAQASIFALATRYEGYGIVFGEAMQRGLPIVTCHAGAVPDTVGGAAHLVPPDDAEAFAAALRELLTDAESHARLSAASRARGAALPRWPEVAAGVAAAIRGSRRTNR